jgi:hypothetical protein
MLSSKTAARTSRMQEQVIEHDGLLWKPRSGATTNAQEFVDARTTMIAIHKDSIWNPWVREECADELEEAERRFSEWTRAEPGFRPITMAQWRARERRDAAKAKKRYDEQDRAREERRARYDPAREADRLALLELENGQRRRQREHDELVNRTRFPAMDDARRADAVAECRRHLEEYEMQLPLLRERVGEPESVVDEHGRLPSERRELARLMLSIRREQQVRELRTQVRELSATLDTTKGRTERAKVRDQLTSTKRRLELWLAIPPVDPRYMCSECSSLQDWHESGTLGDLHGPCPAWPQWAARLQKVREMLMSVGEENKPKAPAPEPKPTPIAVLPSGLPISEVISRLTELQGQHPQAEVRRGRANRWEIWPAEQNVSVADSE